MKKAKIMNFDSSSGRGNLIVEDGSKIEFETNMWVDFHNLPEAGMEVEVIEDDKNVISLKQFSEQDIQDSLETKDNNENKIIRTTIIASKEEYEQAIKEVNEFQKKLKEELILEKPFEFALALKEYHSNNGYECLDEYINENQANYELALPDESSNIFINYQSSQNIDNKGTFSYKKDGVEIPLTFELFENTSLFINTHIETSCLEYNSDTELFENFILEMEEARFTSERRKLMEKQVTDYLVNIRIQKMERTLIGDPVFRGGQSVHGLIDGGPYVGLVKIPVAFDEMILSHKEGDEIKVRAKLVDFSTSLKRPVLEANELL
ncbi:MAG: hypothetical protein HOM85_06690 [Euryarchaeota archaeon]|nr:hypothetical protein [Euryarchaeota archaeon]